MRYTAYCAGMKNHNLCISNKFLYQISSSSDEESIYNSIKEKLALDKLPNALICDNVLAAFYTVRYLQKNNINIPNDISIVLLGTNVFAKRVYPSITAVEAPLYDMGLKASEFLFDMLENGYDTPRDNIVLQWQYVQRES